MNTVQRRAVAIALAMLCGAAFYAFATGHPMASLIASENQTTGLVVGMVLFASSVLLFLTTFDQGRSSAWLRLDWFTPTLRRQKKAGSPSHSVLGRWIRNVLPQSWQSNRKTKQRGLFRRTIRRLGISWLASPVRRCVQAVCLLTFLTLFFYVCWPYDARPVPPGLSWSGWSLADVDQGTGEFVFSRSDTQTPSPTEQGIGISDPLFVFANEGMPVNGSGRIGQFELARVNNGNLLLVPREDISSEAFDALLSGTDQLVLHQRDPTAWPSHYAENLRGKEVIPAETFLVIDPLVSLSTAVASRSWVWSLASAACILLVCVLIPRGFCGYLCPLGTTIDLFDWAIAGRTKRFRVPDEGWWVHIKYYLLAGTMVAAVCGVLVSGFFSAIPVITRGLLFLVEPFASGGLRGWHLIPSLHSGHFISLLMFATVLGLGFLRPRFWCKYVCPSGAVFSLGNLFRATERKVESSCINCNKCIEICPFDAIKPDFTTRTSDCTMCQSCGGVCPTHAIKFVERWNVVELKVEDDPPTNETTLGRRGFLSLAAGSTAATVGGVTLAGATKAFGANLDDPNSPKLVRPPGSVPEQEFLEMCIRCGECYKACPNNVLQPEAFQQGLEGLWTPMVNADWAGCESSCNACGQVCPTGAIRALPLEEKKVARMGLAIVNESTCLPLAGREDCDLCVQECDAAGYHAIEYMQVGTEVDENGLPIEGSGFLAPVVLDDQCVGCGLCQTRCYAINVKEKHLLSESAIIIEAGEGKEDRLMSGSYVALREQEQALRTRNDPDPASSSQSPSVTAPETDDPFGLSSPTNTEPSDESDPFGLDN